MKKLIEDYGDIDDKVTKELVSVTALIEIKEETKAIMSLAKIIENLLKKIYGTDSELLKKRKYANFSDYIDHAHDKKILNKEEFHFLSGVREIRNQEAHELMFVKSVSTFGWGGFLGQHIQDLTT